VLEGGGWSTPHPEDLPPKKKVGTHFHRRLGGPRGRSGCIQKISPPPEFESRTVKPVGVSTLTTVSQPPSPLFICLQISFCALYTSYSSFHPRGEGGGVGTGADVRQPTSLCKTTNWTLARSVYECFLQLHLFSMRNHVFAVTYLKRFKFVIIHCLYRRYILTTGKQQCICQPTMYKKNNFNLK
jgi:hypothetical protein